MDLKAALLKDLLARRVTYKSSSNADEKSDVSRKQSMLLGQISKASSESERMSIQRHHFKEYNFNNNHYYAFVENRTKSVDSFLRGLPRDASVIKLPPDEFLRERKSLLEPRCSGNYRSCFRKEVNADDLKMFKKIFGRYPSVDVLESPPRKQPKTAPLNTEKEVSTTKNKQKYGNPFPSVTSVQSVTRNVGFRTAREELIIQNAKKNADPSTSSSSQTLFNYGASKKSLGARRTVRSGFVPPIRSEENFSLSNCPSELETPREPIDERLKNIDPKMVELISNEIMHTHKPITWDDIAGLEYVKSTIKEAVVWPLLRPDIFTGLRRPPRGILLFGPPGTGKTLIGKCIAFQSKSTFFSISASSLTSKWVGDGEKMVRALFAVAAVRQPSVVFIDEIDSLLTQRSKSEDESTRRLKTEFLIQLDGASTEDDERILIVGATNRPQELDEAARRRLVRRLYIPLPDISARIQILTNLLKTVRNMMSKEEILEIGNLTGGYSGADMETLCREASMEPIRSIPPDEIPFFSEDFVRPVEFKDFRSALTRVRPSVSQADLQQYVDWNKTFGAGL